MTEEEKQMALRTSLSYEILDKLADLGIVPQELSAAVETRHAITEILESYRIEPKPDTSSDPNQTELFQGESQ